MTEIWTIQKILSWTVNYFTSRNIPEPRPSAEILLAHTLNCQRIELYLQFERILTEEERRKFREYVKRRARHEPVQYITGKSEFMGLPLKVTPAVLIPRPETEILVEQILQHINSKENPALRILDVGTGSGCIAIVLAKRYPDCEIWAVEKSASALALAKENACLNDVNIHFVEGDIFQIYKHFKQPFDLIAANPPYVAVTEWQRVSPEVRDFEPKEALLAGQDGLDFYRGFSTIVTNILNMQGTLFLETGHSQAVRVARLLADKGLKSNIIKDDNQIQRIIIAKYEKH